MSPSNVNRHHVDTSATEAATLANRFVAEALPLHDDLLRAARRRTHNPQDAEDLIQETYAKAWTGFHSFTPGSNLRAWMLRIMVNTWISTHRKTLSRPSEILTADITDAQTAATVAPSTEFEMFSRHIGADVRQALQSLPAILRTTIFYADVCNLPHKEIALLTNVPVGTVMSRVHNARRRLRAALDSADEQHTTETAA